MRFIGSLLFFCGVLALQPLPPAEPLHRPLALKSPVEDKNFYLLSLMSRHARVRAALKGDPLLARMTGERRAAIAQAAKTCGLDLECNSGAFLWTDAQIDTAGAALAGLNASIDGPLRASGTYIRYHSLDGPELVRRVWADCMRGINHAIRVYALGEAPRYAAVDSITYDPKTDSYRRLIQHVVTFLDEDRANFDLVFTASLRFATEAMLLNHRDEAGRFEPMELGENAAAFRRVKSMDWSRYPYTAILILGSGNDRPGIRLSAYGKLRDEIGAKRFRDGKAPFLIVSGGFVHPKQTEFAEAIEMKHDLMTRFSIPESAILVDPHARHTTTNFRNAARLLYRYGFPFGRKVLVTTDPSHSESIENPAFAKRCIAELGYMPLRLLGRISPFDLEFVPLKDSLQINPEDPLDP